jgi:hypothetical protein
LIADGGLYFANVDSHQIGVYHIDDLTIEPFAVTSQEGLIDGPSLSGAFTKPSGFFKGDNKLFLADSEMPYAVFVSASLVLLQPIWGKVYIADYYNHKIKVLDLKTHNVTKVKQHRSRCY